MYVLNSHTNVFGVGVNTADRLGYHSGHSGSFEIMLAGFYLSQAGRIQVKKIKGRINNEYVKDD